MNEPKQLRSNRRRRDLHFLNSDGMVACNPRDREAAHRAHAEGIATENPQEVTCRKCFVAMKRAGVRIHSANSRKKESNFDS